MKTPVEPIRLHRHPLSGHAHRVELLLSMLGLPFETIDVDLVQGEQKSPAFLALNPFGEVPVIEDGETVVPDSNAILVYLAAKYDDSGRWMPADPLEAARVQRWLSVAAGRLAFGPAAARVNALFGRPDDPRPREIADALLALMETHLESNRFLAGDGATIADLAMYTYTSHAPEGGVSLQPWKHVRRWLADVEALPRFRGMMRIGDEVRESA